MGQPLSLKSAFIHLLIARVLVPIVAIAAKSLVLLWGLLCALLPWWVVTCMMSLLLIVALHVDLFLQLLVILFLCQRRPRIGGQSPRDNGCLATGRRAAPCSFPRWHAASHRLEVILVIIAVKALGTALAGQAGTLLCLGLSCEASAWDPRRRRAIGLGLARCCCRWRLAAPAPEQRPGAVGSPRTKVLSVISVPGNAPSFAAAARPLATPLAAVAPRRAATVALRCAAEAWICFTHAALPVALATFGGSLARAARAITLGTSATGSLATTLAAAVVTGMTPCFALASSAA